MKKDEWSAEALQRALGATDVRVIVHDVLDSTNTEAKRLAAAGVRGTTLVAASLQTAGRGRMGRSFYSPDRTGVYFSLLYTPRAPLCGAVSLTGAAAVAVMRAIKETTGRCPMIKWVNDLYLDGKKICGILAESLVMPGAEPQVVLGIGVNLSTASFPKELEGIAGSLHAESLTRCELIAAIYREIEPFLSDPADRSWLEDYRRHSMVLDRPIEWRRGDEVHTGVAEEIGEDGELVVRDADGVQSILRTGEISVRVQ